MKQNQKLKKYQSYKYTSFEYINEEDLKDLVTFYESDSCVLLYNNNGEKIHVHWAAESQNELIQQVKGFSKEFINLPIYLEFVPETFVDRLNGLGFAIYSEFADFWLKDLTKRNKSEIQNDIVIRQLREDEFEIASKITYACKGQSRGFDGESVEATKEWYETKHSTIFVAEVDNEIAGIVFTGIYGFENADKITTWIRLLAVSPKHQKKGIGQSLLAYALEWGVNHNAKRSFLHADVHNDGAINMYKRTGYEMVDSRGQINMQLSR